MNIINTLIFFTLLLIFLLFTSGCSDSSIDHYFNYQYVNDVYIAENSATPKYSNSIFVFEPILEILDDPTIPESQLYNPRQLLKGFNNMIYVSDNGNNRVAVFDDSGNYLFSFGQSGSGPGDLSHNFIIINYSDDTISIFDYNQQRLNIFDCFGNLITIYRNMSSRRSTSMHVFSNNIILHCYYSYSFDINYRYSSCNILTYSINGSDSLYTIGSDYVVDSIISNDDDRTFFPLHYSSHPFMSIYDNDHFIISDGSSPTLYKYSFDGILCESYHINFPIAGVTDTLIQRYYDSRELEYKRIAARFGNTNPKPLEHDDIYFNNTVGFWSNCLVDNYGFIWLQDVVSSELHSLEGHCLHHIISPSGEYLGTADVPIGRTGLCFIIDGCLYSVVNDDISNYRIPTVYSIKSTFVDYSDSKH